MGRRRRRWREPAYVWWIAFLGLLATALVAGLWRLGLIALLAWCLYEFALVPTVCRVRTRQGFACPERVRGRLFACAPAHQQVKNEALWHTVGLTNLLSKRRTSDPNRDTGVVVYSPAVRARLAENDRTILLIAGLGTVVTLIGTILGLLGP